MAATTKVPLGAATTNRKWFLDVEGATADSWLGVFGITEFKDTLEASMQDDSDFDGEGWLSEVNTANRWKIEAKVIRKTLADTPTSYDPGQEKIRQAAGNTGVENVLKVRWYEMEPGGPRVEAYEGFAAVSWSPDGGNTEAVSTASIVLSGRGKRNPITHPETEGAGA
ncbi:major tail protein [Microbacterium phage Gingerbug]|nr:major tail protein [Microbacterium phage Gingerbug]